MIKRLFTGRKLIKYFFNERKYEHYKNRYERLGFYCCTEFPDKIFYKYLVEIFNFERKEGHIPDKILFQALARYPTQLTYKLFEQINQNTDDSDYQLFGEYLMIAILKYPNEIFNSLKEEIKLDKWHKEAVEKELIRTNIEY